MRQSSTLVAVIGAGPAGLAVSYTLARKNLDHVVFERGEAVGHSWSNVYESLRLHTGKHMSALPGMPYPGTTPLFPSRQTFLDYLQEYALRFKLPIETDCVVTAVGKQDDGWQLSTPMGELRAQHLVMATGIMPVPNIPQFKGQEKYGGHIIHTALYRCPEPYVGKKVLVVGVGNSGAEIATELNRAGAHVAVSIRTGANFVPLTLLGVPIQYYSRWMQVLPKPLRQVIALASTSVVERLRGGVVIQKPGYGPLERQPVIGFSLVNAVRDGSIAVRTGIQRFTSDGTLFIDGSSDAFDEVILATGYRAAIAMLDNLVHRDERGFALRNRVVSMDQPNLYFVGHNYGTVGALLNIGRDAGLVARIIASRVR